VKLLATELRRFTARRAVRWLVVLALAVIALGTTIAAVHSKVKTERSIVTSCGVPTGVQGTSNVPPPLSDCKQSVAPRSVDHRFNLRDGLKDAIGGTGVALLLLGVLLGTTFIGADYAGGALPGQLTYEPRRTRVYGTKAVAVGVSVAIITTFLLLVLTGALAAVAHWRGVVGHLDGSWYVDRLGDVGRVAGVCALAAAIGYAVTAVARRSVVSVVAFLGLGFIVEPALTASLDVFDGRTPMFNLIAVAINDFKGAPEGITSLGKSAVVACIWGAALLLFGGVVFARREVR
jgi:hypothetical protein